MREKVCLFFFIAFLSSVICINAWGAPFAYITNVDGNNISVIDTATNTVTATVATGGGPLGVAVNPAGTRVYVTIYYESKVSVIETASNTIIANVPVGEGPYGVAVDLAGTRIYVTNFHSHTVSVIDAGSNSVIATIPTGTYCTGIAINPAGTRAYVANSFVGTVSVIDTASNAIIANVPVGGNPFGVAVNPTGTRVYASTDANVVSVIDTGSNALVGNVPIGSRSTGIAVNPTGTHTYVAAIDVPGICVIDNATNTVSATATMPIGTFPTGLAVNTSGRRVYTANQVTNNVTVMDTQSNTIIANVPVGLSPFAFGAFIQPMVDTTEFVKQQYRDFLNREEDSGGLQLWVNMIDSGTMTRGQVIESFFWSEEFGGRIAPIVRLYFAYFLRIPDYAGLMYWVHASSGGASLWAISDSFDGSEEFGQRYGSLSNGWFVQLIYHNILGRSPDAGGYAYWVGELNSGRETRGQVMVGFSESEEYKSTSSNEVFVTMMYVGMLRRSPEQAGFDFWVNQLDSGGSGLVLIDGFLNSQEYASRFQGGAESCVEPPAGLISWWPGEGSATDIIGSNDGVLQGGATFAPGMVGQAFSFDSIDDFVSGATTTDFPLGSAPRTITAWIKAAGITPGWDSIIFHYGVGNADFPPTNFHLAMYRDGRAVIGNGFGYGMAFGTTELNDGQFHFLAGVYEGPSTNLARIYVDGIEEGSAVIVTPGTLEGTFTIGQELPIAHMLPFKGLIDEVDIYNRALSAAEIQAIFLAGKGGKCKR